MLGAVALALGISVPVLAQQPAESATAAGSSSASSQAASPQSPQKDGNDFKLPVSLDRIREGLAQPAPADSLKGLNDPPPTFRIEIREQQKFDELVSKLKFDKGGPQVPGGVDAYDQYQRLFPRIDNPRVQPYGAFSTGEILTLSVEALVEKYLAQKMSHVVGNSLRAQAEREAREEVARSLAQFWASQSTVPSAAAPSKE
jgi:hypothetical protein